MVKAACFKDCLLVNAWGPPASAHPAAVKVTLDWPTWSHLHSSCSAGAVRDFTGCGEHAWGPPAAAHLVAAEVTPDWDSGCLAVTHSRDLGM